MEETKDSIGQQVDLILREGYCYWDEMGLPPLREQEKYRVPQVALEIYGGSFRREFAAACQCFFLFRRLHQQIDEFPACSVLLGDYFFGMFSQQLIPLDNVPLIDAFSEYLEKCTREGDADYEEFIRSLAAVVIDGS